MVGKLSRNLKFFPGLLCYLQAFLVAVLCQNNHVPLLNDGILFLNRIRGRGYNKHRPRFNHKLASAHKTDEGDVLIIFLLTNSSTQVLAIIIMLAGGDTNSI